MKVDNKKILVIFLGTHNAGPVYAYEMTKGLIQNGAIVSAIVSSYTANISAWRSLPLKKLVELPTYHDKREFLFETCKLFLYKNGNYNHFFMENILMLYILRFLQHGIIGLSNLFMIFHCYIQFMILYYIVVRASLIEL